MKKIKEILKDRLVVLLFIILMLGSLTIFMLIVSSNKYEDEISNLRVENKKLNNENKKLNNENKELNHQITEQINAIDSLLEGNKAECECDCGWYEDFYYEHAEEFGAYE